MLVRRPWTLDQNLVMHNDIDGTQQPSNISMIVFAFWIHLYNMPTGWRSTKHISLEVGSVRKVVEVEYNGVLWDTSARDCVHVDVLKPLRRVQKISMSKGETLVEIKYERLPTFCYLCGIIGHI